MRVALPSSAVLAVCLSAFAFSPPREATKPVTVCLVRHAETAASTETTRDPDLSAAGQARAGALAELLGASGVTHVFASEFVRTQQTVAPLAEAAGLEVVVVPARELRGQLELVRALEPGALAVVCGHSNTVPALVRALGGDEPEFVDDPRGPRIDHDTYERLFLVTLPVGEEQAARAVELTYGAAGD